MCPLTGQFVRGAHFKITDELRRSSEDNHEAVHFGWNSEAIKAVRPKFNSAILPNATIRETADELTLRPAEAGMLRTFIKTTDVGGQLETTTGGRRLARSLSSHQQERRGSGMGDLVLQVCEDAQVSVRSSGGSSRAKLL